MTNTSMNSGARVAAWVLALACGCGQNAATQRPAPAIAGTAATPPASKPPKSQVQQLASELQLAPAPQTASKRRVDDAPVPSVAAKTLEGLLESAKRNEFNLPVVEEGKVAAAGIRRLAGRHVTVYTDLPAAVEIDELPAVFDAAVPLWAEYFAVPAGKLAEWKLVGCVMRSKDRFVGAGLYAESLPDFPHGYSQGSQFWLFEQPSGYYRRHLMLHEGTHCFMQRWLGGAGPPWYMEGIAELLATHRWAGGKLTLGIMPATKEELPYWGRVKIVKDELAAGKGLTLPQIMQYDNRAHLRQEPYGWCWAAAAFLDQHPLTQAAFRELKSQSSDRSIDFSQKFIDGLKPQWTAISQDWAQFVQECDYGYDFARAAVVHKPALALPVAGMAVTVDSARGWQSSGVLVEAGKRYEMAASGRFQVDDQPRPWPCEAGGVTIRYHAGRPLGMLLASVDLAEPLPVAFGATLSPPRGGTLYFKINEAAGGLADNSGTLSVSIKKAP
jgi:hypothetical protein